MKPHGTVCLALLFCACLLAHNLAAEARDRYLLLDDRVVESFENAVLRVGTVAKHPANPLFGEEHPWEVRFDNVFPNVIFDEEMELYRVWYKTFTRDAVTKDGKPVPREQRVRGTYRRFTRKRSDGLCYAVSKDGIAWGKPLLDLHPWNGEPTNLVMVDNHGVGVFKDLREEDPARRYKMIARELNRTEGGMGVRFSADGKHWSEPALCPEMKGSRGDTHNNAFWAPELGKYVAIARLRVEPWQRAVGRTESADFLNWTEAVEVLRGTQEAQAYSMPVFRHAGVYLGLPAIYHEHLHGRGGNDRTHTELAWSPDTVTWHRIDPGTPLIPNAETNGHYDWGCVYASAPVFLDDEVRLYYGASNGPHSDWRDSFLALATLRPDGFAGYQPDDENKPAVVTTRPVPLSGATLTVTCDAGGGSVTVAVVDEAGNVLRQGRPITADVTDAAVRWQADGDLKPFVGKTIRLRFDIDCATLYSFGMKP